MAPPLVDPLAGHAGGAGTPSTKHPIGVPDDYTVPVTDYTGTGPKGRSGRRETHDQAPRYHDGFQFKPLTWGIEMQDQLQQGLIAAGLLNPDDIRDTGSFTDPATVKAWTELLSESNRGGVHWRDMLNFRIQGVANGDIKVASSKGREKPPLTIQLTNPDDIKTGLDKAAPDMLGRKLSPSEMEPFVQQYHDLERQAQTQAYDQQYNTGDGTGVYGPGGTVIQQPSLDSFITQQIENKYKPEYQANTIGENGLYFLKMLSQGAGSVGLPGVQS